LARSHYSFEKRRKELEKKKKKDAKRQAKAERKAAEEAGEVIPEPEVKIDEFGNVVEIWPEGMEKPGDTESDDESEDTEQS